jgi:hypothetical protein
MWLENTSASTGKTVGCFFIDDAIGCKVTSCKMSVNGGFALRSGSQSLHVDGCVFTGSDVSASVGVYIENGGAITGCDFTNLGNGIRHCNAGLSVTGCRMETNITAIVLGSDADGNNFGSSGVFIGGMSMESNICHIRFIAVSGVYIVSCGFTSFEAACDTGIEVYAAIKVTMDTCGFSGGFLTAPVYFDPGQSREDFILRNVTATNSSGSAYSIPSDEPIFNWENTNFGRARSATISGGVISALGPLMIVDTQASAASDDLDTINTTGSQFHDDGLRITLRAANDARTVVVKDSTGNLSLTGDCTLDDDEDTITLVYDSALSLWLEVSRSDHSNYVALQGLQTIWVPASAMTPRTTNGAAATSREINSITLGLLAFDQTTSEGANFSIAFPKSWDAGTITFRPHWTCASGTGTVSWTLNGGSFADNVAINVTGIGTGITVTDTLQNVDRVHNGGTSSAVTLSNAADSVTSFFQIVRTISDTLNADAELIGIEIFYTTNVGNDA